MVWSLNQRWIQSTLNDQLFAISRWNANMISSFLGSLRFGSIVLDLGTNTNFGVAALPLAGTVPFALSRALAGTVPSGLSPPFQLYLIGMLAEDVLMLFGLTLENSVMYMTS